MARRVRTIPIASAGGWPEISIADNEWTNIEKAYGHSLTAKVRRDIVGIINEFLYWEVFERNAEPLSAALKHTASINKATQSLLKAIWPQTNPYRNAISYAEFTIKKYFDTSHLKLRTGENPINALASVLMSLGPACRKAFEKMDDPNAATYRKGDCWRVWIKALTKITRKNKLPFRVSKGSDKSDRDSPFVLLVAALQQHVPAEARRHHHSNAALAKAISEARRDQTGRIKNKSLPIKSRMKRA